MVYVQQGVMPLARGACRGLRAAKNSQNESGGLSLDLKNSLGLRVRHTPAFIIRLGLRVRQVLSLYQNLYKCLADMISVIT